MRIRLLPVCRRSNITEGGGGVLAAGAGDVRVVGTAPGPAQSLSFRDFFMRPLGFLAELSCFLTGFLALIFLPTIHGMMLFSFCLPVSVSLLILQSASSPELRRPSQSLDPWRMSGVVALLLFVAFELFGALINDPDSFSPEAAASVKLVLIATFAFLVSYDPSYRLASLYFRGFIAGCVATSLWMIADAVTFYLIAGRSLNDILFASDAASKLHSLTNIEDTSILPIPFFRPSGLSWDPGISIPGLVLGVVLGDWYRWSRLWRALVVFAVLLSFSRTAYLALGVYFAYRLLKKVFPARFAKQVFTAVIAAFCLNSARSLYRPPDVDAGSLRHLRYIGSLVYMYGAPFAEKVLGYGLGGSGVFFDKRVPWGRIPFFRPGGAAECGIVDLALAGGCRGGGVPALFSLAHLHGKGRRVLGLGLNPYDCRSWI